jgi:hypothetical protein
MTVESGERRRWLHAAAGHSAGSVIWCHSGATFEPDALRRQWMSTAHCEPTGGKPLFARVQRDSAVVAGGTGATSAPPPLVTCAPRVGQDAHHRVLPG